MVRKHKGGNIKRLTLDGRIIVIIGLNHSKAISQEILNNIISFIQQFPKTCILVEENSNLSQKAIMSKTRFYEPTTELIVKTLKNIDKKCINGWDIRPSMLGDRQNGLYGKNNQGKPHFVTHTLSQIEKEYINKTLNKKKYSKILDLKKQMSKKEWEERSIHDFLKHKALNQNYMIGIMTELREDFKNIADQHILKIIKNNTNKNFIILAGDQHYHNLIKLLR